MIILIGKFLHDLVQTVSIFCGNVITSTGVAEKRGNGFDLTIRISIKIFIIINNAEKE